MTLIKKERQTLAWHVKVRSSTCKILTIFLLLSLEFDVMVSLQRIDKELLMDAIFYATKHKIVH